MATLSRRQFLSTAASAALLPSVATAIDPIVRPGKTAQLTLSLAAYSFRKYLDLKKPTMNLFQFMDFCVEQKLTAVELTSYYFTDTSPEYLTKLRDYAKAKSLVISGVPVGNNFCKRDEKLLAAEVKKTQEWIERAGYMGAKTVRIFAGNLEKGDTLEAAQKRVVASLEQCCETAKKAGVLLAMENHGGITATPEQLLALVKPVKSAFLGVNIDTGNFRTADPYADVKTITPYGVNVQVKTEVFPNGKEKVEADLKKMVQILKDGNYHGYVALEYEAAEEPKIAVPKHLQELKALLA